MIKIPFVDFPKDKQMESALPDGIYATISHNPGSYHGPHAGYSAAFPWRTVVYVFKGGVADELGNASDAGAMLTLFEVTQVFLIGLAGEERRVLDENLATREIELVPAPKAIEGLYVLIANSNRGSFDRWVPISVVIAEDIAGAVAALTLEKGEEVERVVHVGSNTIIWNPVAGILPHARKLQWFPFRER